MQMNPDACSILLKLCKGKMWLPLQSQSLSALASALVPACCDGTWAPPGCRDTDCQLVLTAQLLHINSLLPSHRYSAFPHLPSVLHEKAVDQHNAWKGLDGRFNLPLLPGTLGACNSSGDLGGVRNGLQRLGPSTEMKFLLPEIGRSIALNRALQRALLSCMARSSLHAP